MIEEWTVNNDGHSVVLNKERHSSSDKDILTADVKVSSLDNNILVEKGDGLFVMVQQTISNTAIIPL